MSDPGEKINDAPEDGGVRAALENAVIETTDVVEEPKPQEIPVEVSAPDTWSQEDKDAFGKIQDPEVRKWLVGKDQGYTQKLTDYETRYKGFDDVFAPYNDRMKEAKQEPVSVIKNLLAAQMALETHPEKAILWLAQNYKIDLAKVVSGAAADPNASKGDAIEGDPLADLEPGLAKLIKTIAENAEKGAKFVETQQQSQQREQKEAIDNATKEFREESKDGQLLYPYMANKTVTDRMALLIKNGDVRIVPGDIKAGFKEAYEQAIYSIPAVRAELEKAAIKPNEEASAERLRRAKRAGVGVTGVGASAASPANNGSVRENLRQAARSTGFL